MQPISDLDKKIIKVLQGDFPLVSEPYAAMAKQIGISQELFLERVKILTKEKKIRKMGAVLRHREVGFAANVLVAWEVPSTRLDEVAEKMAQSPAVSHCYDRNTAPDWPYNLYTMVHATSRAECEAVVADLGKLCGINNRVMLYSKKEWKKTTMRYFGD